jgi:hypothetical protein
MFPELTFVLFLNSSDVFICWNILALSRWQMQGLSVDIWYLKISIAQDNIVFILLGSVASLIQRYVSQASWQSVLVVVPIHWNLLSRREDQLPLPFSIYSYESPLLWRTFYYSILIYSCPPIGLSFLSHCSAVYRRAESMCKCCT